MEETAKGLNCRDGEGSRLAAQPRKAAPARIVLVDDEDCYTEVVEMAIHQRFKNVIVHTFHNRDEAWQALLRSDPDLLITDMNNDNVPAQLRRPYMGMSGWKMLPLLAERKVKYPILVVSGSFLMRIAPKVLLPGRWA
jgi:DNA-binding NarL/FixJ family response regulator